MRMQMLDHEDWLMLLEKAEKNQQNSPKQV